MSLFPKKTSLWNSLCLPYIHRVCFLTLKIFLMGANLSTLIQNFIPIHYPIQVVTLYLENRPCFSFKGWERWDVRPLALNKLLDYSASAQVMECFEDDSYYINFYLLVTNGSVIRFLMVLWPYFFVMSFPPVFLNFPILLFMDCAVCFITGSS